MTVARAAPPAPTFAMLARHFVTGVAVALAGSPEQAHGVTVSTLSLVSHRPPMVALALRTGRRSAAALHRAGGFAVSVLAADQSWLAHYFAAGSRGPGMGELGAGHWRPGAHGPLLSGAIGWLECRLEQVVPTGDHQLLLARVLAADTRPGTPLVNFAGRLHAGMSLLDAGTLDPRNEER
jgi:flavin reductase (DIM6/NTAB) family NADH-FMN oxidoreductase RutF